MVFLNIYMIFSFKLKLAYDHFSISVIARIDDDLLKEASLMQDVDGQTDNLINF